MLPLIAHYVGGPRDGQSEEVQPVRGSWPPFLDCYEIPLIPIMPLDEPMPATSPMKRHTYLPGEPSASRARRYYYQEPTP